MNVNSDFRVNRICSVASRDQPPTSAPSEQLLTLDLSLLPHFIVSSHLPQLIVSSHLPHFIVSSHLPQLIVSSHHLPQLVERVAASCRARYNKRAEPPCIRYTGGR